ncbi:MAG: hypothetical protein K9I82_03275 [Chitinophagaceae bacterium]|nr:hypothetical protein [Chitinophagaceae bacterium]
MMYKCQKKDVKSFKYEHFKKLFFGVFFLLLSVLYHTVNAQDKKIPSRLLFIGNSFTYRNGGLEMHIMKIDSSTNNPKILKANRATRGGATLKILYNQPWVHDSIHHQQYDVVVLQEDIPELTGHNTFPFFEYATLFNQEINAAGAKAVLLMAWQYERLNWVTMEQIAEAHRELGNKLKIPVAPVGLAFQESLKARPAMAMLGPDKEHATIQGTYLEACVVYTTIYGRNIKKVRYSPSGVSVDEGKFLRKIAWKTMLKWKRK